MIEAITVLHVQTRRRNLADQLILLMNNALSKNNLISLPTLKVIRFQKVSTYFCSEVYLLDYNVLSIKQCFYTIAYSTLTFDPVTLTFVKMYGLNNIKPMYEFHKVPTYRSRFTAKNVYTLQTHIQTVQQTDAFSR